MEPSKENKTGQYIERLKQTHKYRRTPKGLEGLTFKQKDFYNAIKNIVKQKRKDILKNQQIKVEYEMRYGELNFLPTDFCYNLVNVGPDFETKFLINIERGKFKFVDFHSNIENKLLIITWTPKGRDVPPELKGETFEVGEYYKGKYHCNFSQLDKYL